MEESLEATLTDSARSGVDMLESAQEISWIRATQAGDVVSFNRLVLRWEKSIFNLTLRLLQDRVDAEEATQEVFMSAFKNIGRFRRDSKFSTWIYRIAVNHCLSRLRKRPAGAHLSLDDPEKRVALTNSLPNKHSHEQDLMKQETHERVRNALDHLPPDQKTVVELKFFQELTFEQIAEVSQIPISTVKSRLYSGLEILKLRLGRVPLEV